MKPESPDLWGPWEMLAVFPTGNAFSSVSFTSRASDVCALVWGHLGLGDATTSLGKPLESFTILTGILCFLPDAQPRPL